MTTTTTINRNPRRAAAITALAAVGFITLIALGIMLAIYSARFVPAAVSRIGTAAVQLSQVFVPAHKTDLTVVPQIPFGAGIATSTATTTLSNASTTTITPPLLGNPPAATNPGPKTTTTYPAGGATNAPLYGQPDLTVTIDQMGYVTSGDQNFDTTFVGSNTVPSGQRAAVKFTIRNAGTNISGNWFFRANLPSTASQISTYNSSSQNSLRPGEAISYTLAFDQPIKGAQTMTITVDPNNQVAESNEGNNSSARVITIQ